MEESDKKSKKSAPVTKQFKSRTRPRKAKLRGVRLPRGLCRSAGIQYSTASLSPYKGDNAPR